MDVFGCFSVSSIAHRRKGKFLQKIVMKKKSLDLFDQFFSTYNRTRNCQN